MADKGNKVVEESRIQNRQVTDMRLKQEPEVTLAPEPQISSHPPVSSNAGFMSVCDDDFEYDVETSQFKRVEVVGEEVPVSSSSVVKVKRGKTGRFERYSEEGSSSVGVPNKKGKKDTSWMISEPCPGGPFVPHVIPSFGGHIAYVLWSDPSSVSRPILKGYHRWNKVEELREWELSGQVRALLDSTGLWHLGACMAEHINMPLICAFVERWQPDTNTFHLPFGEITLLLHDVAQILGIREDGEICQVSDSPDGDLIDPLVYVCDFFGKSSTELRLPLRPGSVSPIYKSGGVLAEAVKEVAKLGSVSEFVQGYMALLLGTMLFVDKSGDRIRPTLFPLLSDNESIRSYAWGAGTLAYLYRQLGMSTRAGVKTIAGCLSLMQAWIFEYFPLFRPGPPVDVPTSCSRAECWKSVGPFVHSAAKLMEYRRQLDGLTVASVRWEPFGTGMEKRYPHTLFSGCIRFMDIVEPYQPDRCLRQFGYRQVVPGPMARGTVHRPASGIGYKVDFGPYADHPWNHIDDHRVYLAERSAPVSIPGEMDPRYAGWYQRVSHPLIIDPESAVAPIVGHGVDVTAETAHAILDRLSQAESISDDIEQLRFFRSILRDFHPLQAARGNCGSSGGGPMPGSRGARVSGDGGGDDSSDSSLEDFD